MLFLTDHLANLNGKTVLIRADLNVPQDAAGNITDQTRIVASIEAIQLCLNAGAKVMVTSHLGRPQEGIFEEKYSLEPIRKALQDLIKLPVVLVKDWVNTSFSTQAQQLTLLENCRFNVGEKKNHDELAQKMANLCDVFVHDAFGTAHRAEASTHGIAKYAKTSYMGPLLAKEYMALSQSLQSPKKPLLAIVGGSKVSTKLSILKHLANQVDYLIVGGGIANTFLAAKGIDVGASLCELDLIDDAKQIIASIEARGGNVPLPSDVVVSNCFKADANFVLKDVTTVNADEMILDIGPQSLQALEFMIKQSNTIVWNGPLGVFEFEACSFGTKGLAQMIANSPAFSIAGGGDTIAAINQFKVTEQIDYISTGGGAFLEFLEGKKLPALEILETCAKLSPVE